MGPGPHPNGTPQTIHSGGGKNSANAKALRRAEAAGQRIRRPITSVAQLTDDEQASFGEIWQPFTRKHKDGTTTEIHVDRAEVKRHIAATIAGATPEQVAAGKRWYADAHDFGAGLATEFGVEPRVAFGVIAALSPNTGWGANKTKARKALRQFKSGKFDDMDDETAAKAMKLGFAKDAVQAVRIMRDPEKAFAEGLPTGPKRGSFVNNMAHPDQDFDVTVDGWVAGALQRSSHGLSEDDALAWVGRSTRKVKAGLVVEDKGYIAVADVVREIAADAGMTPAQAQAVYWVASGGGTGAAMWDDES